MDIFLSHRYAAWMAVSFLYGIITHQRWFRRFELDRYPLQVAGVFVAFSVVLVKSLQSYSASFVAIATYLLGLCLSTLVHRALFQPLKRFPGPFAARLSKFWAIRQAAKTQGQWYKFSLQLHAEYGDYVRIGMCLAALDKPSGSPSLRPS